MASVWEGGRDEAWRNRSRFVAAWERDGTGGSGPYRQPVNSEDEEDGGRAALRREQAHQAWRRAHVHRT